MKKSSKASSKKRDRSNPEDSKTKRSKVSSSSKEKGKSKEESKQVPRKTRWQADDKQEVAKNVPTSDHSTKNQEKSGPTARIRDHLHDREKIVELLFQTVTGAALQELIPDYLKKHPKDELKKLCLEEIKKITDDAILQIIAGKVDSSNKEEKSAEKGKILKPEEPNISKKNDEEKKEGDEKRDPEKKLETSKIGATEIVLPDEAIQRKTEKNETLEEENQIPLVIKDEVAKDLILPERDAELLELEMRARAIRSLLKAKCQSTNEEEDIVTLDED